MVQHAEDLARVRWGIDKDTPVILAGTGDGQAFEDARKAARILMPQLVGLDGIVRKNTLAELESLFTSLDLKLVKDATIDCNPPGRMLFYRRGRLLVRIKTKGNPPDKKYRVDQPHLSVVLMKGEQDIEFDAEVVKFSPAGRAQPKSTDARPENRTLLPVTGTAKKPKFDGNADVWSRATHFNFAPGITLVT
jgi:hypothetical protein